MVNEGKLGQLTGMVYSRMLYGTGCLVLSLSLLVLASCQQTSAADADLNRYGFRGETMGTTYSVLYYSDEEAADLKAGVDSLLIAVNEEVSNWDSTSTVSRFNRSAEGIDAVGKTHFLINYELARSAWEATDGAFEPTIMPLTNYYGFGYGPKELEGGIDTPLVTELMASMGMDAISLEGSYLRKSKTNIQLDLGGSAKGYGVDAVAEYLSRRGVAIHYVEIGGEARGTGRKPEGPWTVGVNLPEEGSAFTDIVEVIPLENRSVATSGNYRNYYQEGGQTYSHTINPKTGFPERNRLLSASVLAPDCGTADAFATACMVLGPEAGERLIEDREELEGYFLIRGESGELEVWASTGMGLMD
ncbi:MAG: FAD:protein FMN transferase [Bacteroidota bacterium]